MLRQCSPCGKPSIAIKRIEVRNVCIIGKTASLNVTPTAADSRRQCWSVPSQTRCLLPLTFCDGLPYRCQGARGLWSCRAATPEPLCWALWLRVVSQASPKAERARGRRGGAPGSPVGLAAQGPAGSCWRGSGDAQSRHRDRSGHERSRGEQLRGRLRDRESPMQGCQVRA